MRRYDVDRIVLALVEEGQDNSSKYGFRLGDVIRFTPMQVGTILSDLDIEPERKKGRWIDYSDEGYVECPFCHSATNCDGNKDELHYCFSCGAELRGEQNG